MPSASRPALAYMISGLSWSWKMSGSVSVRTLRPRSSAPRSASRVQHEGAEAAHRALLDRDQRLVLAGEPQDQVHRRAAWRNGRRRRWPDSRARPAGRRPCSASARRVPNERIATAEPSRRMRPRPISSGSGAVGDLDADAVAARIAEGARPVVDGDGGGDHVRQLGLVGRAPSARSPAAGRGSRRRSCRRGSGRRRRPARRGRWRSAPAGAGSPRRAPPGRSRAAGRWSRSPRTASCRRRRGRRRRSPRAARRCRRRRSGRGSAWRTCRGWCPTAWPR